MGALRDFIEDGIRDKESFFYDRIRRFWKNTGKKAKCGIWETWIRAILYKCTGRMDMREALAGTRMNPL